MTPQSQPVQMSQQAQQRRFRILSLLSWGLLLFGVRLWLIHSFGNATPFWDQWDAEADRLFKPFLEGNLNWVDLFATHNEHRIFTSRILSLILLELNGLWNPLLQMAVNALLHLATVGLLVSLISRLTRHRYYVAYLIFSAFLLGIPFAWENSLSSFQSPFYFLVFFSTLGLFFLVTRKTFSIGWWLGLLFGCLAFVSLASGVFVFAAAAVVMGVISFRGFSRQKNWFSLLGSVILLSLFTLGVLWTPRISGHAMFKAQTLVQFLASFEAVMSWPFYPNALAATLINVPGCLYVIKMLRKGPKSDDPSWYLFGLVVLSFGQIVSICYGRAVGSLSSRYLDLFALSLLTNFSCLIDLLDSIQVKNKIIGPVVLSIWSALVAVGLGFYTYNHAFQELSDKKNLGLTEERNVRNFLATGDSKHLYNKPPLEIPYPDPARLEKLLTSPSLKTIFPSNIRAGIAGHLAANVTQTGFTENALIPTILPLLGQTYSSFGTHDDKGVATILVQYPAPSFRHLSMEVAGFPLDPGIKLEVTQGGQSSRLTLKNNPSGQWQGVSFEVEPGEFSIRAVDASPGSWVAFSSPVEVGRFDAIILWLLDHYWIPAASGLLIAVAFLSLAFKKKLEKFLQAYGQKEVDRNLQRIS